LTVHGADAAALTTAPFGPNQTKPYGNKNTGEKLMARMVWLQNAAAAGLNNEKLE